MTVRILIVEDENLVALDISESLKKRGYQVIATLADGEDVYSTTAQLSPDIILMDIVLRGEIDGISAAAEVRGKFPIPIIFITAHADEKTLREARVCDPESYLVKPFDERQLYAAIELALYRQRSSQVQAPIGRAVSPINNGEQLPGASQAGEAGIINVLRPVELFSELSEQELISLARTAYFKTLTSGEILVDEGELNPLAFIVCVGRVSLIKTSADGKEFIAELLSAGDILGLWPAFENVPSPYVVRAQCDVRLLVIPSKTLAVLTERNSSLSRRFSLYLSQRLRNSHALSASMVHDDAFIRVVSLLNSLLPPSTMAMEEEQVLEITRRELASLTGLTVETVVRVIKGLERRGFLRCGHRGKLMVLRPDDLRCLLQEKPDAINID